MEKNSTLETYQQKKKQFAENLEATTKKINLIGTLRLIIGLFIAFAIYKFIADEKAVFIYLAIASLVVFLCLIKIHEKLEKRKTIEDALVQINTDEIAFLAEGHCTFANGVQFFDEHHFYAHDLDIFGENSLYQRLNRTHTQKGQESLANYLLHLPAQTEILDRQKAIVELKESLDWRQGFEAISKTSLEQAATQKWLINWSKQSLSAPQNMVIVAAWFMPIALFIAIVASFLSPQTIWADAIKLLVGANLALAFSQFKLIKKEINHSQKVTDTLKNYGLLIAMIEKKKFNSSKLYQLQKSVETSNMASSDAIAKLARIYAELETVNNPFGAFLFNALFLYHLHVLNKLKKWKAIHAMHIEHWLQTIGEFETLNSLANFAYNNTAFVFPKINQEYHIAFKALGHPHIDADKRVCNDFEASHFVILTGSNMSGKSTFLRSIGINMILGQMGAPVCAKEASLHPVPLLVTMRLSDSLNDNESYFFAEVKRLKKIMDFASTQKSFVLLDEILRETNSDDKRTGTVGVIKKILSQQAMGLIATHDLKVCDTTNEFPDALRNQCFEVEIINNELVFDYQLRNGICKNKSATFLMQKMEVI